MTRQLLAVLGLTAACLGCTGDGAQARARVGFGRSHVSARPSTMPASVRAAAVPSVGLPLRTASAADPVSERGPAEDPVRTGGIPVAPPTTGAVPPPKSEAPWCATGTVVGSGRGFCIIN